MSFWKDYTLRWLFYRKTANWELPSVKRSKYQSEKRCSKCKNGVNSWMGFSVRQDNGIYKSIAYCPHCSSELLREDNTNISHGMYKKLMWLSKLFWIILDRLHLVASGRERYGLFGDESHYIEGHTFYFDGRSVYQHKKRKWWEYVIIRKR